MEQHIELNEGGIQCDHCDWSDPFVSHSDAEQWLNKPCPKCGENLLTQGDYERWMQVIKITEFINSPTEDQLIALGEAQGIKADPNDKRMALIEVHTHNGISAQVIDIETPTP